MVGITADELTDSDGSVDPDAVRCVIDELFESAERAANAVGSDDLRDARIVQDGLGRVIGVYILLRTGDRHYRFSAEEFDRLERTLNNWLDVFAKSRGVELESAVSIRTAAEALLETDDVYAVAEILTGVSANDV